LLTRHILTSIKICIDLYINFERCAQFRFPKLLSKNMIFYSKAASMSHLKNLLF
jgi:hypothetical protein